MTIVNTEGKTPHDVFKKMEKRPNKERETVYTFPGMSPARVEAELAKKGASRKALSEKCHAAVAKKPAIEPDPEPDNADTEEKTETADKPDAPKAETATAPAKGKGNGKPSKVGQILGLKGKKADDEKKQ